MDKLSFKLYELVTKLNLRKSLLPGVVMAFVLLFATTGQAYAAFNATESAKSVLQFIALIILIAAAVGALTMIAKGMVMQALMLAVGAGLLYVLLGNPDMMQNIGDGLNNLLFNSGGNASDVKE